MSAADGPPAATRRAGESWDVADLLGAVSQQIALRFASCTVQGELSGYTRASSGHCYFSLKDADGRAGLIRCAMFRRAAVLLDFLPADGQHVRLRGRLSVYEPRGELQLVVESMLPAGAGSMHERFLRLKARLEAEGLFDAARKRPLPAFPRRLGIVTSLAAAVLHDVASTLARRSPQVGLIVYPTAVQGADAPALIAAAIATGRSARRGRRAARLPRRRLGRGSVAVQRRAGGARDRRLADPGGERRRP